MSGPLALAASEAVPQPVERWRQRRGVRGERRKPALLNPPLSGPPGEDEGV